MFPTLTDTQDFLGLKKIEKTATCAYALIIGFTPCKVNQSLQDMHLQEKEGKKIKKSYLEDKNNKCLFTSGLK